MLLGVSQVRETVFFVEQDPYKNIFIRTSKTRNQNQNAMNYFSIEQMSPSALSLSLSSLKEQVQKAIGSFKIHHIERQADYTAFYETQLMYLHTLLICISQCI